MGTIQECQWFNVLLGQDATRQQAGMLASLQGLQGIAYLPDVQGLLDKIAQWEQQLLLLLEEERCYETASL